MIIMIMMTIIIINIQVKRVDYKGGRYVGSHTDGSRSLASAVAAPTTFAQNATFFAKYIFCAKYYILVQNITTTQL